MAFNLEDYEPVEDRIKKFYTEHPTGRIITEIVADDGKRIIFKAYIYRSSLPDEAPHDLAWATGFAEEVRGEGLVNKTSAVENCETSAIGRALANANYAGSKRPSREEMTKSDEYITEAQRKLIFARLRDKGLTQEDQQKNTLQLLAGVSSSSEIKRSQMDKLLEDIGGL